MNKRAFSIVELMAVLVVIALITLIAVTAFSVITYENSKKLNERTENTIINAAEAYCSTRLTGVNPVCVDGATVSLDALVLDDLLEGELVNHAEEVPLDTCSVVTITAVAGSSYNFEYTYDIEDAANFDGQC